MHEFSSTVVLGGAKAVASLSCSARWWPWIPINPLIQSPHQPYLAELLSQHVSRLRERKRAGENQQQVQRFR